MNENSSTERFKGFFSPVCDVWQDAKRAHISSRDQIRISGAALCHVIENEFLTNSLLYLVNFRRLSKRLRDHTLPGSSVALAVRK